MYQPLIKFHPHPAIITQVLRIFIEYRIRFGKAKFENIRFHLSLRSPFTIFVWFN